MLSRRARLAGIQFIEAALSKTAFVSVPTLASLKAKKTRELNSLPTASAEVPKVVSTPL